MPPPVLHHQALTPQSTPSLRRPALPEGRGCAVAHVREHESNEDLPKPSSKAPSRDFHDDSHAEFKIHASSAGVHILYVEKAIACSPIATDGILGARKANGTILDTGSSPGYAFANPSRGYVYARRPRHRRPVSSRSGVGGNRGRGRADGGCRRGSSAVST